LLGRSARGARLALGLLLRLLRSLRSCKRLLRSLRLGLQRLEHFQRELDVALLALERIDLLALDRERIEQDPNLSLLRTGDAPELLDVLLAIEIDHDSFRSRCRIRNKSFSLDR